MDLVTIFIATLTYQKSLGFKDLIGPSLLVLDEIDRLVISHKLDSTLLMSKHIEYVAELKQNSKRKDKNFSYQIKKYVESELKSLNKMSRGLDSSYLNYLDNLIEFSDSTAILCGVGDSNNFIDNTLRSLLNLIRDSTYPNKWAVSEGSSNALFRLERGDYFSALLFIVKSYVKLYKDVCSSTNVFQPKLRHMSRPIVLKNLDIRINVSVVLDK